MIQQFHFWGRIYPKERKSLPRRDTCTPTFIIALFVITKTWKQPSMYKIYNVCNIYIHTLYISYIYVIYIMERYSAVAKKGILPFVTTWMGLEGTVLNKIHQREKDEYCMI